MKNEIQSSNLNFLIGSGISSPYLSTLGEIEKRLQELSKYEADQNTKQKILASLRHAYFTKSIRDNVEIPKSDIATEIKHNYKCFLNLLRDIVSKRKSTLLNKQINLFTTNMDIFLEINLDGIEADYNTGFNGLLKPKFKLSHFNKSIFKTSALYSLLTELPIFNVFKLHGSVTWKKDSESNDIILDKNLTLLKKLKKTHKEATFLDVFIENENKLKEISELVELANNYEPNDFTHQFNDEYEKLLMVNPDIQKLHTSLLNQTYYEMLRMYSNELEKSNTLLFVMGFSFADEHISEITLRAAKSNPTLRIFIFAYDKKAEKEITKNLELNESVNNITFVKRFKNEDKSEELPFDLEKITSYLSKAIK